MVGLADTSTDNNTIKYSEDDGVTWFNSGNPFTGIYGEGKGIGWGKDNNGNDLWVAVGGDDNNNTIKYSSDGINWSNANNGFIGGELGEGNGIGWGKDNNGNDLWVAVGEDNNKTIKYSSDGINWSNANNGFIGAGQGNGVIYGGYNNGTGLWVAVGTPDVNDPNNTTIKYSSDGINWSNANNGFSGYGNSVGYGLDNNGNGLWVAAGASNFTDGITIKYSSDGINWSNANNGFIGGSNSICNDVTWGINNSGNGIWLATGRDDNGNTTIKYSYDGINWSNDQVSNAIVGTGNGIGSKTQSPLPPPPSPPSPPPSPPTPISNIPGPIQMCESRFRKCNLNKKPNFSNGNVTIQGSTRPLKLSYLTQTVVPMRNHTLVYANKPNNEYGQRAGGPSGYGQPPKNNFI